MEAKKLGIFLSERRKELGLTQGQLAEQLHVTDKAVSRWERGIGLPDINLLEPLSDALKVSVLELIRAERMQEELIPVTSAEELVAETIGIASEQTEEILKHQRIPPLFFLTTALTCIGLILVLHSAAADTANPIMALIGYLLAMASPLYLFNLAAKYYTVWKSEAFSNYRNQPYK